MFHTCNLEAGLAPVFTWGYETFAVLTLHCLWQTCTVWNNAVLEC